MNIVTLETNLIFASDHLEGHIGVIGYSPKETVADSFNKREGGRETHVFAVMVPSTEEVSASIEKMENLLQAELPLFVTHMGISRKVEHITASHLPSLNVVYLQVYCNTQLPSVFNRLFKRKGEA